MLRLAALCFFAVSNRSDDCASGHLLRVDRRESSTAMNCFERCGHHTSGERSRLLTLVLFLILSLCTGPSDYQPPSANSVKDMPPSTGTDRKRLAQELAAGQVRWNFEASMEMMESVDFLLTPALLIQESITPGVVPTYPSQ